MKNTTISELINTKSVEGKVYQMLETAIIVSETFMNLYPDKIDEDIVFSESETDTYNTLIGIALEIEKQNIDDNPLYIEDIREKAEEMILKEYGKKPKDDREVRSYGIDIVVPNAENPFNEDDIYNIFGEYIKKHPEYDIAGAGWKASWTYEEYNKGGKPYSSD